MKKIYAIFAILLGLILLPHNHVHGQELPTIASLSTDFIAVPAGDSFTRTIAIYGSNLDYVLFNDVEIRLGGTVAIIKSGNATGINATFTLDPKQLQHKKRYQIAFFENGTLLAQSADSILISDPLSQPYKKRHTKKFLKNTKRKRLSKRTVGLNVHWALGSNPDQGEDQLFENKLDNSKTKWAREHISYAEVMGENGDGWIERYDKIMLNYEQKNMRVVVMLAYGAGADRFVPPSKKNWKKFTRKVVKRYRNYADAWEIWNEPDSPSYMRTPKVSEIKPLLKVSYPLLKHYDPGSKVLNGPIGDIAHTKFISNLYKKAGSYFDELSVHLYYCDEYIQNGNNGKLVEDLEGLFKAIPKKKRKKKIWVTELGCSSGTEGVTKKIQRRYYKSAINRVLETGKFRNVLLYTIRDRPYLNSYEANFGLMDAAGNNKPAWKWYRKLPRK